MQQLTGVDASFLYYETPRAPGHVFSLWIYDQSTAPGATVTFKGILDHVRQRLHISRTFRQKLVQVPFGLDHPYWMEDSDFDLEFHVRHIALPAPGDWRQLCIQVARLHSRPLDLTRPLWEMYVIEGLDAVEGLPPGSFAVMQKTHHAAIDGVTLLEITSAIHDREPDAPPPETAAPWQAESAPSPWSLLARAAANGAARPMRYARAVAADLPSGLRLQGRIASGELEVPAMSAAPRTRFSGAVSGHRIFEGRRFDLATVKRIKTAVEGATVNDAAISIVGGALRSYLSAKGELPEEPLRVMVPISTRTAEQAGTAGNQVSVMVATSGSDIEDPRQRLAEVRDSTHRSKAFAEAVDARSLAEFSEMMPGGLVALGARTAGQFEMATRANPIVNTVVSNVPGPQVPLYFAGARLVTLFGGAAVVDGMGLLHGVTSYCGQLMISVVSDREMMPDPAVYAKCLDDSYAATVAATGAGGNGEGGAAP
jgi:diacylglycerol O-acyltransferase / wax synthase